MILVDTSIWIDHFRHTDEALVALLSENLVLMHPFVEGELALGNLPNRKQILYLLSVIPKVLMAKHDEVLIMLSKNSLYGRGLGWVDLHLMAAGLISEAQIWTRAKRLHQAAKRMGVCYNPKPSSLLSK